MITTIGASYTAIEIHSVHIGSGTTAHTVASVELYEYIRRYRDFRLTSEGNAHKITVLLPQAGTSRTITEIGVYVNNGATLYAVANIDPIIINDPITSHLRTVSLTLEFTTTATVTADQSKTEVTNLDLINQSNADIDYILNRTIESEAEHAIMHLWDIADGAIPEGYQLCDGTNGTIDTVDKYIASTGDPVGEVIAEKSIGLKTENITTIGSDELIEIHHETTLPGSKEEPAPRLWTWTDKWHTRQHDHTAPARVSYNDEADPFKDFMQTDPVENKNTYSVNRFNMYFIQKIP